VRAATRLLEHAMIGALRARQQDDDGSHRAYLSEARKGVELIAKLAGLIGDRPAVQIDVPKHVAVLANLSEDDLEALEPQLDAERVDRRLTALV
jgi:hypothetical protein